MSESKMADVNTENSSSDRKNGEGQQPPSASAPLLRPSTFKASPTPKSGVIHPGHMGSNPFVAKQPPAAAAPSDGVMSNSSISSNPFATKLGNSASADDNDASPAKFILRPSVLDKQTASLSSGKVPDETPSYRSSFKLEPAKIQNPFQQSTPSGGPKEAAEAKEAGGLSPPPSGAQSEEIKQRLFGGETASSENGVRENYFQTSAASNKEGGEEKSPTLIFGQKTEDRADKGPNNDASSSSGASGFVFGQNLRDRVIPRHRDKEKEEEKEDEKKKKEDSSPSAAPVESASRTSLEESAAQYKAKLAKPEMAKVDVKTGEEEESNVFQLNAKLYVFETTTQTWIERGRGFLRLNDLSGPDGSSFQSRLVMRTQGSLRLVMNTKVWPGMTIQRASPKSLRISAVDQDEGVKIFLITATSPKDSDQIFSAIDSRVQQLKSQEEEDEEGGGGEGGLSSSERSREAEAAPPPVEAAKKSSHSPDKRTQSECSEDTSAPKKKRRVDPEQRREAMTEESNDSSAVDPETEASNESFASSPTIKSSSSDA